MKPPVVFVLTHESNPQRTNKSTSIISLALTRSLGRRGIAVVRVHPNHLDRSLLSRYCKRVELCPNLYESEDGLVEFLLAMAARYEGPRVLLPASDDCAYFLAKHFEKLRGLYAIVGPSWQTMQRIIDKKSQYELAQALALPVPETYYPSSVAQVQELAGKLCNYPYVVKPTIAHQWRLASMQSVSKGKKGFAVANARELIERYGEIAPRDPNVMVQEVIGGRDERLYTFLAYCDARCEPLAYCVRKKIRQMPLDFGYCTATVTCRDDTVVAQSRRLLQGVGYTGICGVEWKLDPRTQTYKLIEINARAVNTIGIAAACGVDIPYIAVLDNLGHAPKPITTWQEGVTWVNIVQDIWAARELHQAGHLSLRQWWDSIAGPTVDAVFSSGDPRPFLGYFAEFVGTALGGRLLGKQ